MVIDAFKGEYYFLSNFHFNFVWLDNISYLTVEHAYQAAKTLDINQRLEVRAAKTPGRAKRLGRLLVLREDWEDVKLLVMEDLVRQKFTIHYDLRDKLLATGDATLIEGNSWGDTFWGACKGKGSNHLGQILMNVRQELKEQGLD